MSFPLLINFGSFDTFLDVPNHPHLVIAPFSLGNSWTPAWALSPVTRHPQIAREGDWNCKMCHLVTVGLVGRSHRFFFGFNFSFYFFHIFPSRLGMISFWTSSPVFSWHVKFAPKFHWSKVAICSLPAMQPAGDRNDMEWSCVSFYRNHESNILSTCGRNHQVGIFRVGYLVRLSPFYHIYPYFTTENHIFYHKQHPKTISSQVSLKKVDHVVRRCGAEKPPDAGLTPAVPWRSFSIGRWELRTSKQGKQRVKRLMNNQHPKKSPKNQP